MHRNGKYAQVQLKRKKEEEKKAAQLILKNSYNTLIGEYFVGVLMNQKLIFVTRFSLGNIFFMIVNSFRKNIFF